MTKPLALNIAGLNIERMIAQGGMAEVYLAEQKSLGRQVAVKILDPRGADAQFSARFFQEAKLVASLNHKNIITIYDFGGLEDGRLFLSMEYLSGGDLEDRLDKSISEAEALRILKELGHALNFIHKKNILHRDIKPANILFRQDGSLVLTDFGIAKQVENKVTMTQAGTTIGSPAYCSPEQSQGQPLDHRSDIYSAGVMFLEMLTGSNPYKSDTNINTAIKHIQMPIPALPGKLARYQPLVEKMLAKKPRDRFNSMLDVLNFLDNVTAPLQSQNSSEQMSAAHTTLLTQCAEDSKIFSIAMWKNFQEAINKKLDELLETTRSNMQQWQLLEVSRNLRKKREDLGRDFLGHLSTSFQDFSRGQYKADQTLRAKIIDAQALERAKLSLVENDDLERNIAASTLIRQLEGKYNEELSLLHERFCHIIKKELPLEACPVGPHQLAQYFKKTIQPLQLEKQTTALFFKTLEKNLLLELGVFYKDLNKSLVDADVLPKLTITEIHKRHHPSGAVSQSYAESGLNELIEDAINQESDNLDRAGQAAPIQEKNRTQSRPYGPATPALKYTPPAQPIIPDAELPSSMYQQQLFGAIRQMQQNGFSAPPGASAALPAAMNDSQAFAAIESSPTDWSQPQGFPSASQVQAVYSRGDIFTALNGLQNNVVRGNIVRGNGAVAGAMANAVVQFQEMQPGNLKPCPVPIDMVMEAIAQISPDEGDAPKQLQEDDSSAIDLVSMIFEYMLQDDNLPDSVKALLSYLQVPYTKVALLDPDMFARVDHPARVLLNKLSEAGSLWLNGEGYGQFKVFDEIKGVVSRILTEFDMGVELFDQLVIEFDGFVNKVKRRVEQLEKLSAQKMEAQQHLQKMKAYVHKRIKTRVNDEQVPAAIVAFLLYPWFDYLTSIMLRYGEKSEQWQQGLQVIDNLLWSMKPKTTQHEVNRLNNLREVLRKQIQKGFDTIGYDHAKAQDLLKKVDELQEQATKNNNDVLKVSEEDRVEIQRMKKELTVRELVVQAPSSAEMTEDEKELVDKLRLIEFGTWFEFKEEKKNELQKLKVAWFNNDNLSYLMVNSAGKQVSMMTALEIARQMIAQTARIIAGSAKPFFERALEAIYKKMVVSLAA